MPDSSIFGEQFFFSLNFTKEFLLILLKKKTERVLELEGTSTDHDHTSI